MTLEEPTKEPTPPSLSPTQGEVESPTPALVQLEITPQRRPRRLGKMAAFVLLLGVSGAVVWYWGIREPESKDDLGRFQGDWKLTIDGQSEQEGEDERPLRAVRISGDCWQYLAGGKEIEGKTYRIKLNETTTPKEIELTLLDAAGNPVGRYGSHGVYALDRKTARILVEPVNKPRPTNLDNPSPDAIVWVLTKVKLQLSITDRK
ncbi:MAG TPA: TIGR03067 domain-containing protein [Gemmata sp.]|nr:TIGR03067 domain-containing protein [Gemmata sp.]